MQFGLQRIQKEKGAVEGSNLLKIWNRSLPLQPLSKDGSVPHNWRLVADYFYSIFKTVQF